MSATALACTPLLLAPIGATASPAPTTSRAATPHLTATLTGKTIEVTGADHLRPGRVKLSVEGKGVVEIAMFKRGYDGEDFNADIGLFGAKNDIKALKHALANTQILGGFEGGGSGTVVLPRAGSYTPFSIGRRGVVLGDPIIVRGEKRASSTPRTDGRILATTGPAWGGSTTLPAQGRLLFKNKGNTGVPHFLVLQQVAEGTTTDTVLEYLQSGDEGQPPWGLPGGMESASLSPGRSMTVDYDLPAGQYVVMCFFPDPKMDGMPHALMGMLEMIHLT
ncbi:hypothetical protein [Nocardioides zhouii]|uniref:Blue (type 1) copper domain-containing protein n=1 Tax=Nocardioides zhouii TaxID=1168729 RepID=A0A4Q2TC21_9ACTN|nr:hypothetical protein [Nocardioides zhouii]RYC14678.1 hypothetical protein EUA94_00725 [Nocardioides zhouii]